MTEPQDALADRIDRIDPHFWRNYPMVFNAIVVEVRAHFAEEIAKVREDVYTFQRHAETTAYTWTAEKEVTRAQTEQARIVRDATTNALRWRGEALASAELARHLEERMRQAESRLVRLTRERIAQAAFDAHTDGKHWPEIADAILALLTDQQGDGA